MSIPQGCRISLPDVFRSTRVIEVDLICLRVASGYWVEEPLAVGASVRRPATSLAPKFHGSLRHNAAGKAHREPISQLRAACYLRLEWRRWGLDKAGTACRLFAYPSVDLALSSRLVRTSWSRCTRNLTLHQSSRSRCRASCVATNHPCDLFLQRTTGF